MAYCLYVSGMAQDTESRHLDKFVLRMPDGMRDRIRDAAEANNRSMNAEIVARLEQSFDAPSLEVQDAYINDIIKQSVERTTEVMIDAFTAAVAAKKLNNIDYEALLKEALERRGAEQKADDE